MKYQEVYRMVKEASMKKEAAPMPGKWLRGVMGNNPGSVIGAAPFMTAALGQFPGAKNSEPVTINDPAYLKLLSQQNKRISEGEANRAFVKDLFTNGAAGVRTGGKIGPLISTGRSLLSPFVGRQGALKGLGTK